MSVAVDAVVLGAGPAGLSAAITLCQAGRRVRVLVPRHAPSSRVGDSLAPEARPLLAQLGVWAAFEADRHLPCHATRSVWGRAEPHYLDFIHHPQGPSFHIDRALFDQRLLERALGLGVRVDRFDAPPRFVAAADGWSVEFHGGRASARWVIDGSGRASSFARRQGAARHALDRQVAVIAFLQAPAESDDSTSLIEAVPGGWWYSAPLPGGRWSTAFFTDVDLHARAALRSEAGWRVLLQQAPLTSQRLAARPVVLTGEPAVVSAGSARLDRFTGPRWLAVGDAALTYDPLSAHGLTVALRSGIDAADAICAADGGDAGALAAYEARLARAFDFFARARAGLYRAESRFALAPYWQRRHREHVQAPMIPEEPAVVC